MYRRISLSPDGNYVLITQIKKPFSYLVTYGRFPSRTDVYSKDGELVTNLIKSPLIEELPIGFMSVTDERRNFSWRADKPSTIFYVKALDGGDLAKNVKYRDEVFQLDAPFNGKGISLIKTINRFNGIDWGTNDLAIAYDSWWNTRNRKSYAFNPSNSKIAPKIISDRNYQDVYTDPGNCLLYTSPSPRDS